MEHVRALRLLMDALKTLVSPPSVALTAKNTYDKQSLIDTINASSAASNNGRWNIKGSSSRPRPISSQGQPPSSYLFCLTPASSQSNRPSSPLFCKTSTSLEVVP